MRGAGCRDPKFLFKQTEVERMAGLLGQLFKIVGLRAPISFTERVDMVHVADDPPCLGSEFPAAEASKEAHAREAARDIAHARLDKASELELIPALGDFDCPNFAGPIVDILEQMPMDRTEVVKIETARRDAFRGALNDKSSLDPVQPFRVGDAEPVP
jgi:hypothetical protein